MADSAVPPSLGQAGTRQGSAKADPFTGREPGREDRGHGAGPEVRQSDSSLAVNGGRVLAGGEVAVSGFKHSLVTTVAAAAAANGSLRLRNCPDIAETRVLSRLLSQHGAIVSRQGSELFVDASGIVGGGTNDSTEECMESIVPQEIHGAVYLVPALLAKTGTALLPTSGGCQIGDGAAMERPVSQYLSVLHRFGASSRRLPTGTWELRARRLEAADIDLLDYTSDRVRRTGPLYSGATKIALLAAALAHGVTTLWHPYPKPDATDLIEVLRQLGADIDTGVADRVVIRGGGGSGLERHATHDLVPDLIEVVTWLCAGTLLCGAPLRIEGGGGMRRAIRALAPELDALRLMGVPFGVEARALVVHPAQRLRPIQLVAASHGIYSDSQPFFVLLAAMAEGVSRIGDTVWRNRFTFVDELVALGVHIDRDGAEVCVRGPSRPSRPGHSLDAADLRAAAVLLLAALLVPGHTRISCCHHLARGYADLPGALGRLGADITAMSLEEASR